MKKKTKREGKARRGIMAEREGKFWNKDKDGEKKSSLERLLISGVRKMRKERRKS